MRIAVVGAGIGGLTAALALLRRGFEVDVYEQAPELKEVGAGLQLSANATRVLGDLGVLDQVIAISSEPEGKEIRLWNTGQTWKLFDLAQESIERYGFPYLTMHRNDLHQVLAKAVAAINPDAIHLDHKLVDIEQDAKGVTLQFADKPPVKADLAIGADGVHSKVREKLFGFGPATFTGIVAWRGVIPAELLPERLLRPVGSNWVGPGGHVISYPLRGGELMNFTSVVERADMKVESWSNAGTNAEYHADYPGWHEDVHTYIEAMPQPFKWALLGRPPMDNWTKGRITLLGDACHPMLPFMASGAAMAIEDGLVLARTLKANSNDYARAFAIYQDARIERTTRCVNAAWDNAKRFHNPELAHAEGAAAYVDREWSPDKVAARYEWLFQYDAGGVDVEGAKAPA
jgi:salicylate hydroxylase